MLAWLARCMAQGLGLGLGQVWAFGGMGQGRWGHGSRGGGPALEPWVQACPSTLGDWFQANLAKLGTVSVPRRFPGSCTHCCSVCAEQPQRCGSGERNARRRRWLQQQRRCSGGECCQTRHRCSIGRWRRQQQWRRRLWQLQQQRRRRGVQLVRHASCHVAALGRWPGPHPGAT